MIPNGRLESEKWLSGGMGSQDLSGAIARVLVVLCDSLILELRTIVEGLENDVLSIEYLRKEY